VCKAFQSIDRLRQRVRSQRILLLAAIVACAAGLQGRVALAQATWTGTASGAWSTGSNWVGTPPTNGSTTALTFVSATSGSVITATNDLTGLTVSSLTLGSPRDVTLAGNAITLTGGITNNTGSWQFVTLPISLAAGDRSINGTTGRLYLTGSLSGSSAIVKTGGGDLVVGGQNTLTGAGGTLTINGSIAGSGTFNRVLELSAGFGNVYLTNTAALGSAANYVNFVNSANGTLHLQTDTSMTGYSINAGSGQGITINVDRATSGATVTHTLGTLNLGSASATFNRGGNVTGTAIVGITLLSMSAGNDNSPVTIAGSAQITIGTAYNTNNTSNGRRLQLDGSFNGNTIGTIGNVVPGGPAGVGATSVIKANSSTWILTASNSYTGSTTINAGTLQLGNGGTTGSILPSSQISGASGATLAFNRSNTITQGTDFASTISGSLAITKMGAGNLVLSGSNSLGSGSRSQVLLFQNANSGTVTLQNTAALGASGNVVRFSGGGSGVLDLQTDASVNAYDVASGQFNGGTIIVNRATAGAGVTHTLGLLDMSSVTITANTGANVVSGTARLVFSQLRMDGGNDNNPVTLAGSATWSVGFAGSTAGGFSKRLQLDGSAAGNTIGAISDTTNATAGAVVNVIKANASTWTLTGSNTYTGSTTVNQGTLQIGTGGAVGSLSPSSAITGSAGATLAFSRSDTITQGTDFAAAITGGLNLQKLGAGTLALSGNNSFSGATSIAAGILTINGTGALAGTSGLTIAGGAGLVYTGGAATFGKNVIVTAGSGTGTITNTGGGLLTLSGNLSKDNSVLRLAGGSFNVTGLITGTTVGASDLVVDAAAVTLSNTNTYNGPTFVYGSGTLAVGIDNAIPSTSAVYLGNATTRGSLVLGTYSNSIGQLLLSGSGGSVSLSGDKTATAQLATAGSLTLGSNADLVLTNAGTSAGLYRLISAASVTGTFASVTGASAAYQVVTTSTAIDYQQRAVLGALTVTNPVVSIITGGSAAFTYTAANSALAGGASLSVTGSGLSNVVGASSGAATAAASSPAISGLVFTGTAIGSNQEGTFTVSAPLAFGATTATGTVAVNVLDHALPGFSASGITNPYADTVLSIDFGTIDEADGLQSFTYSLLNLASQAYGAALTAGLDFTGVTADGDGFASGLTTFDNLVGGGTSNLFSATFTPSGQGSFSRQFTLSFFDNRNLSGATARRDMTINAQVIVVPEPGSLALAGAGVGMASWVCCLTRLRRRSCRSS